MFAERFMAVIGAVLILPLARAINTLSFVFAERFKFAKIILPLNRNSSKSTNVVRGKVAN